MRQRNRLHKRAKTNNVEIVWANFRKKRNDGTREIRKAKTQYKQTN